MNNEDGFLESQKAFKDICNILSPPAFSLPKAIQILQNLYLRYLDKGLEKDVFKDTEYKDAFKNIRDDINKANNSMVETKIKEMKEILSRRVNDTNDNRIFPVRWYPI